MKVRQTLQAFLCDLAQYLFAHSPITRFDALVDAVERPGFAVLHANDNGRVFVVEKGTVVLDNVVGMARPIKAQLSQNLTMNVWIGRCTDRLISPSLLVSLSS